MAKLNLKSLVVSGVLGVISVAMTAAPLLLAPRSTVAQPAPFTCGPGLRTYIVKPLDNRSGFGIRCVKFGEAQPGNSTIPKLAWYGEGNWNGGTYRHVGHAFFTTSFPGAPLVGFASDTSGNGETFNGK